MNCSNKVRQTSTRILGTAVLLLSAILWAAGSAQAFNPHQPFDISADMIDFVDASQTMMAEGHVVLVQSTSTLHADYVEYDRDAGRMHARGNVILHDKGEVYFGDELDYDLQAESGTMVSAKVYAAPWRIQAHTWEKRQDYYIGRAASFTSCDLVDPHYHIRSSRIHLIPDRFFWAWNNRFYADTTPFFYSPFIYRDLTYHRVVFQAQPGNDDVNGAYVKTTTTMRFTPHVYDKALLDIYTNAGNGYGNEFDYQEPGKLKGSLFAYYINPRTNTELTGAPNSPQYNVRSYHWERLPHDLTLQSNVNMRENVSFNDQYFQQDTDQAINDITSSVALTKQSKLLNQRIVVETLQAPDIGDTTTFAQTHIQSASLPRYEFSTMQIPIWAPHLSTTTSQGLAVPAALALGEHRGPINLNVSGNIGEDYERADDQYRTKGASSANLSEAIPLSRRWIYTPAFTTQLNWQDRYDPPATTTVLTTGTVIPIGSFRGYQGRVGTTQLLRYRPSSSLTLDQTYTLTDRLSPNTVALDRSLADGGVEANHLNWLVFWRPSRTVLLRSYSGMDYRRIADEDPNFYRQRKFDPWTSEMTLLPLHSRFDYFFREELGWYPTRTSLWEAMVGYAGPYQTRFRTGLLYNGGQPGFVTWNNDVGLFASTGWRVDATFHSLVPTQGFIHPGGSTMIDSSIIVTRDLHCWQTQFIYRKIGVYKAQERSDQELESQFYPWRDREYAR